MKNISKIYIANKTKSNLITCYTYVREKKKVITINVGQLYNNSPNFERVPDIWKLGNVTPIQIEREMNH